MLGQYLGFLLLLPHSAVMMQQTAVSADSKLLTLLALLQTGETCLALPKLNLQFLTAHDYLLRNFNLFRLEATYEIREDLGDVLSRVTALW